VSQFSQSSRQDAHNKARDVLIGYLCEPPYETEENLKVAVYDLAREMDLSYEATLRYLMTGFKS
jgi:hypothetical protein